MNTEEKDYIGIQQEKCREQRPKDYRLQERDGICVLRQGIHSETVLE